MISPPSRLLGTPTGEHEPAVEYSSAVFAAAAGLDADCVCYPLDDIAKSTILVANEPRKAHSVRLAFPLVCAVTRRFFLMHGIHLLV
jgi:hypothetical protein